MAILIMQSVRFLSLIKTLTTIEYSEFNYRSGRVMFQTPLLHIEF